jgi:hypothetical protein
LFVYCTFVPNEKSINAQPSPTLNRFLPDWERHYNMTKSQFKSFGFWLMTLMVLMGLLFFLSAFLPSRTEQQKPVCIVTGLVLMLLFGSQLWRDAKIILIDTFGRTISFKNLFTRQQTISSFDQFDGFIDTFQSSRGGTYRVIYLVKDRKFIRKISSFYYSNLDELQNSFVDIKYLGRQNFNIIKSFKILFNMPVLK